MKRAKTLIEVFALEGTHMAKKKKKRGGAREGAGRPKKYTAPPVKVCVLLDQDQATTLDSWRETRNLTRTGAIQDILRSAIQ